MFISPVDLSDSDSESEEEFVSDPESTSDEDLGQSSSQILSTRSGGLDEDSVDETLQRQQSVNEKFGLPGAAPGEDGMPDFGADGHAAVMTHSLLEFFFQSRAADMLNEREGTPGRYTRDSPEARALGRELYHSQSHELAQHGWLVSGIDGDDWSSTRQLYRAGLDQMTQRALNTVDSPVAASMDQLSLVPERKGSRPSVPRTASQLRLLAAPEQHIAETSINTPTATAFQVLGPGLLRNGNSAMPLITAAYNAMLPARYAMDFSEVKMLGRGGYGTVYQAVNHVDGQNYAVKKIPLSQKRLQKLGDGGLKELDSILKEIRTMARLEHVNVVRYYGAWAEHPSVFPTPKKPRVSSPSREDGFSSPARALLKEPHRSENVDGDQSFGVVFGEDSRSYPDHTQDPTEDNDMLFSGRHRITELSSSPECSRSLGNRTTTGSYLTAMDPFNLGNGKHNGSFMSKHSYIESADASDEESQSHSTHSAMNSSTPPNNGISFLGHPRNNDISPADRNRIARRQSETSSHFDVSETSPEDTTTGLADDDLFSDGQGHSQSIAQVGNRKEAEDAVVILHIQMSLHPLSLSTYLSPLARPHEPHRHCFHIIPSLQLLLSVLSGVEYLHSQGIVHRDLKPSNIFLSESTTPTPSCVNTKSCADCTTSTLADSPPKVIGPHYIVPRIGDFGLVADIARTDGPLPAGTSDTNPNMTFRREYRPVGTEFYRPPRLPVRHLKHSVALADNSSIDEKLDVFALGAILFELLYRFETRMERHMVLAELTMSDKKCYRSPAKKHNRSHAYEEVPSPIMPCDFAKKLCLDIGCEGSNHDTSSTPTTGQHGPKELLAELETCIRGMLAPDPADRWSCTTVRMKLEGLLAKVQRECLVSGV